MDKTTHRVYENDTTHKFTHLFPHLSRKTIQVIALIAHLRTRNVSGPFIVVAPLATLPNWVREFEKWLPSVPVCRFHGSAQDRDAMLEGPLNKSRRKNADYPIIVTSYEVAIRDEKRLNKIGEYTFLVVDEGQRLKNHRCTLISSLKRIRASNRLLLSGTPIQVREEILFIIAMISQWSLSIPSCVLIMSLFFCCSFSPHRTI